MRLPQNILTQTYTKPRIFLCEANKEKICQLETTNTSGTFKFNTYSELSFEVSRLYNDLITGENRVNPYYDKIEALRLIYLEGFGYFEIQTPALSSDGIKEIKTVTAYSAEYALAQKYLEKFYINTGEIDSVEVLYAAAIYGEGNADTVKPVVFYTTDPDKKGLSLLDLIFDNIYGWDIGHVDDSLCTLSRTFEIDRQSVYDFLMNEVCDKFNCYIIFDTETNKVHFYAEELTQKFMGDGKTTLFTLNPAFEALGTVSVNGFKTTQYTYCPKTTTITIDGKPTEVKAGTLVLANPPGEREILEVTDGALARWETDVFVTFDNLSQEINITYDADEIKTKLTVKGADELDIREANMGYPYLTDLSYYCTPEWLGPDLYKAYTDYVMAYNAQEEDYTTRALEINSLSQQILQAENHVSSDDGCTAIPQKVNSDTYGKYFIRHGTAPNYYYTEVSLPDEYKSDQAYYQFASTGLYLTEQKVNDLYVALQDYFQGYFKNKLNITKLNEVKSSFTSFAATEFDVMLEALRSVNVKDAMSPASMPSPENSKFPFKCVNTFLSKMWEQVGTYPLRWLYKETYYLKQTTAIEAGWGDTSNDNYGRYFAVYVLLKSIDSALESKETAIANIRKQLEELQTINAGITAGLDLYTFFSNHAEHRDNASKYMMRLDAFLREDEYIDDNFVYTGYETTEELYKLKRELKECGKIELSKLCQPRLQFSMSMANIYALPEFEPIIDKFQLGYVIKVALRSDYIKQSRLLRVNINFDDFSDFSCEFGDLTNLQTQTDLHADLLAQAISAGKSVSSNKSHWDKGSDTANAIDLRIQRGLLDAVTSIKSMEATQGVEIDNYGIHLRKIDPETEEVDLEEGWITNNKFLYSDDGFQTVQSVYGKFTIDGEDYFGVLAKAVIAGYIEGSKIVGGDIRGGTINIGNGNFTVDEDGNINMMGDNVVNGYVTSDEFKKEIKNISDEKMYTIELTTPDSQTFRNKDQKATMTCTVYEWGRDVTSKLDKTAFAWKRHSSDTSADNTWNRLHDGIGHTLQISTSDVNENANFSCWVTLPEITTGGEEQGSDGTDT